MGRAGTTNPEAYRLYLEGRQLWYGRTPDGLKKSIDLFKQAIAADPNYALAYAGLADSYNVATGYGVIIQPKEAWPLAEAASQKALQLDPSLYEAHAARANTLSVKLEMGRGRNGIPASHRNKSQQRFRALLLCI